MSSSSAKEAFKAQLVAIYGEGPIDPDNFDLKKKKTWDRIAERARALAVGLPSGLSERSDGSDRRSDGSDRLADPHNRPVEQTHIADGQTHIADPLFQGYAILIESGETETIASTPTRRKLLRYLLEKGNQITSYSRINNDLGISLGTLRLALDCFENKGILCRETIRLASLQGMKISILLSSEKKQAIIADLMTDPTSRPTEQTSLIDRSRSEDLSIRERLLKMSQQDLKAQFPHLVKAGFGTSSLRQVLESLERADRSQDLVHRSLEYAEWELEHGKMTDKEGRPVARPAQWVFQSLARAGAYRRPEGYVDPIEKALQEEERRLQQLKAKEEEVFQLWRKSLSEDQMSRWDKERKTEAEFPMPMEVFLREKWKTGLVGNREGAAPDIP
ncbi:MAG: hypothetical protein WCZ10_10475 [Desulfobulbaceae bacterium]